MKAAAVLLCAWVLAGCAYTKPGVSDAERARDEFECQRASIIGGFYGEVVSQPMLRNCMAARGYR